MPGGHVVVGSNPATPTIFLQRIPLILHIIMQALLKIDSLSCERNGILLFDDLSFDVNPGEVIHVVGSNGSGKTTLLRMIAGIGYASDDCIQKKDATILYVGHKTGIKALLTPLENLRWYFPSCSDAVICSALDYWNLSGYENRLCGRLSAGQQQRVALCRLILSNHNLWVLDEPFTSLDATGFQKLEWLIKNQIEKNNSLVITAHHKFDSGGQSKTINLRGGG